MFLWIDDMRPAPEGWYWVKTSTEAIEWLKHNQPLIISFDHDLGDDDTSIAVANFLEEKAYNKEMGSFIWYIHSANPVGRKNLNVILSRVDMFMRNIT